MDDSNHTKVTVYTSGTSVLELNKRMQTMDLDISFQPRALGYINTVTE